MANAFSPTEEIERLNALRRRLVDLNTADIMSSLEGAEQDLQTAEGALLNYRESHIRFLSSRSGDSPSVEYLLAKLYLGMVGTQAERERKLKLARDSDEAVAAAIKESDESSGRLALLENEVTQKKRRYDRLMALLRLRTEQIRFLAGQ